LKEYYNKDYPFLLSNAYMYKTQKEDFLEINNIHLQDLGANNHSSTDPYIVPEVNFRYVIPFENLHDTKLNIENYSAVYGTHGFGRVSRTIWDTSLYNSYNAKGNILGIELYNRSDLYKVELENQKHYTTGRTIPELRLSWRYPWGGLVINRPFVVEPIALMVVGKTHVPDSRKFGHIDSNSYDFSDMNFYKFNRYNGFDFHEYGRRVTYGMDSKLNLSDGYRLGLFFGQFQKLSKTASQKSDIVGRVSVNFFEQVELYYRFRKSPKHLKSNFDEISAWYQDNAFTATIGAVSIKNVPVHNGKKNKISQLYFDGGYDLTNHWNIGLGARFDLTSKHYRQLSNSMRVTYNGDCASISVTVGRDFTEDITRDIKKTRDWGMSVGLKTLNM
jgi:lipopolysaccharide assembly outer membrane protein LptD (OstA)